MFRGSPAALGGAYHDDRHQIPSLRPVFHVTRTPQLNESQGCPHVRHTLSPLTAERQVKNVSPHEVD